MVITKILTRRRRMRQAVALFGRFLDLNRQRLYRLAAGVPSDDQVSDADAMRSACLEWLPQLNDPLDRELCQTTIDLLATYAKSASTEPVMSMLLSARRGPQIDETATPPCDYCGEPSTQNSECPSSEPTALCDSWLCALVHDQLLAAEYDEFKKAGLVH